LRDFGGIGGGAAKTGVLILNTDDGLELDSETGEDASERVGVEIGVVLRGVIDNTSSVDKMGADGNFDRLNGLNLEVHDLGGAGLAVKSSESFWLLKNLILID